MVSKGSLAVPRDIIIIGESGLYIVTGMTAEGEEWLRANVPNQRDGVVISHTIQGAHDIAYSAAIEGLIVGINGDTVRVVNGFDTHVA